MGLWDTTLGAFAQLLSGDAELWAIVGVSVRVSVAALALSFLPAVAVGFGLATARFPGRRVAVVLLQALTAFPTVVVGLTLYLLLSRSGPLGALRWLFTQKAMVLGQVLIAFPVLAVLTLAAVEAVDPRAGETARSLGAGPLRAALTVLREARFAVFAAVFTALSRILSEVGCALMVGGNIAGLTRNITTAIALETAKGEFEQGIALGLVLLVIALAVHGALLGLQGEGRGREA